MGQYDCSSTPSFISHLLTLLLCAGSTHSLKAVHKMGGLQIFLFMKKHLQDEVSREDSDTQMRHVTYIW